MLALIAALPFLGALLPGLAIRAGRSAAALIAGMPILADVAGSCELSVMPKQGEAFRASARYLLALILILLAAFLPVTAPLSALYLARLHLNRSADRATLPKTGTGHGWAVHSEDAPGWGAGRGGGAFYRPTGEFLC
jgi:hypothetical protein